MRELVPPFGVQLDLDYVFPGSPYSGRREGEAPIAVGRGQLKDFIRDSWEDAKIATARVGTALGDLGDE